MTPFFFFLIYLFIYGCVGSLFLCEGFLQLRQAGATLHRGAQAPHHRGLSCCGMQAPDAQAQQLWLTGPVAPRHVGPSQTRARTRVPCIGRQTLNHCATREAPVTPFISECLFPLSGTGFLSHTLPTLAWLTHTHFLVAFYFLIDLQLTYNIILVSGVQPSDLRFIYIVNWSLWQV